jgi:hypothetical protein
MIFIVVIDAHFFNSSGYIANGSEPLLPPGMKELLHEDLNKSFDF